MPGLSTKPLIIDGKGHLMGRLSAPIAKAILQGQEVVIVRAEQVNISGSFFRNKLKYLDFIRKRCNVNPARGPFHHRAPSKILYRTIRGMVPHKTARGAQALKRLKIFEGMPPPYDKKQKFVTPSALKVLCLHPRRKYCTLNRLSHEVGWKYQPVIATLEAKRKAKSALYHSDKLKENKLKAQAKKQVADKIAPYLKVLAEYGY